MAARKSAPASTSTAPFLAVMPPMATIGRSIFSRASASSRTGAGTACGLVGDAKKLPNAT